MENTAVGVGTGVLPALTHEGSALVTGLLKEPSPTPALSYGQTFYFSPVQTVLLSAHTYQSQGWNSKGEKAEV